MKKVGILGSAVVGQTLAQGFQQHGYEVRIGSRSPAKLAAVHRVFRHSGGHLRRRRRIGASCWCWRCMGRRAEEAMTLAGADNHRGKIVIDTTESALQGAAGRRRRQGLHRTERIPAGAAAGRLSRDPPRQGVQQRRQRPHGRIRRTPGGGRRCSSAGTTRRPRPTVADILKQFGWEPADMGVAAAARAIEPLCQLWCIPGFRENHWTHAFKLLWD